MSIGITVELKVEDIANSIRKLKKKIRRRFSFAIRERQRNKKRLHEIKSKKVKTLTREETFEGVL